MKKFAAILLIVLMLISFSGCKDSSLNTEPTEYVPTMTKAPGLVDFGYDKETDTYDRWYLVGSDDVTYIYFSYDNSQKYDNYICTYNLVKSGVVAISTPLVLGDDNHLISPSSFNFDIDLVFEDYFTAYVCNAKERYSRGDEEEYKSYFTDKVFTDEDNTCSITFKGASTCTRKDTEKSINGTWKLTSPHTVVCTIDNEKHKYHINYYDDLSVKSISSGDEILYPEMSESETVNKYKAY